MKNINKFVKNNIDKTEIDTNAAFDRFAKNNELVSDTNSLLKTISNLKRIMAVGFSLLAVIITTLTAGFVAYRAEYNNSYNETGLLQRSLEHASDYFVDCYGLSNQSLSLTLRIKENIIYNIFKLNSVFYAQIYNDVPGRDNNLLGIIKYDTNAFTQSTDGYSTVCPIGDITNKDCSTEIYSGTTLIDSFSFKIS